MRSDLKNISLPAMTTIVSAIIFTALMVVRMDWFQAEIKSGLFHFTVSGQVQGSTFLIDANGRPFTLSLQSPVYLSAALWDAAERANLSENQSKTFLIFDPLTMRPLPVRITASGMEKIEINGVWQAARKLSVEVTGNRQTAWIDADGSVLREEGAMGISLNKISAEAAKDSGLAAGEDLTRLVSVPADRMIADSEKLSRLVLRITGVEISGTERQHFESGILTLGIGMGAAFPDFASENPAQSVTSFGGMLFMMLAVALIGGVVLLEAGPVYRLFMAGIKCRQVSFWLWSWSVAAFSGALALCITAVIVSMRFGENRLKQENSHVPCIQTHMR